MRTPHIHGMPHTEETNKAARPITCLGPPGNPAQRISFGYPIQCTDTYSSPTSCQEPPRSRARIRHSAAKQLPRKCQEPPGSRHEALSGTSGAKEAPEEAPGWCQELPGSSRHNAAKEPPTGCREPPESRMHQGGGQEAPGRRQEPPGEGSTRPLRGGVAQQHDHGGLQAA